MRRWLTAPSAHPGDPHVGFGSSEPRSARVHARLPDGVSPQRDHPPLAGRGDLQSELAGASDVCRGCRRQAAAQHRVLVTVAVQFGGGTAGQRPRAHYSLAGDALRLNLRSRHRTIRSLLARPGQRLVRERGSGPGTRVQPPSPARAKPRRITRIALGHRLPLGHPLHRGRLLWSGTRRRPHRAPLALHADPGRHRADQRRLLFHSALRRSRYARGRLRRHGQEDIHATCSRRRTSRDRLDDLHGILIETVRGPSRGTAARVATAVPSSRSTRRLLGPAERPLANRGLRRWSGLTPTAARESSPGRFARN